jgi:neutral trehalase
MIRVERDPAFWTAVAAHREGIAFTGFYRENTGLKVHGKNARLYMQQYSMYSYLNSPAFCALDEQAYPVPSYDRRAPDYSPNRYWRGPIWLNIDWLIWHGLRRYGFTAYARRVEQAMVELVRQHGFFEYFNPQTGQGHGTNQFSWTAALLLDVLYSAAARINSAARRPAGATVSG